MVLVEPSASKRLAGKAFAVMFGKFWGYPLHFGTSRDDALDLGQTKDGFLARNDHVAVNDHLATAAKADTIYCRDNSFFSAPP